MVASLPTSGLCPPRHCEERSDEAIHSFFTLHDGLLRFARNDVSAVWGGASPPEISLRPALGLCRRGFGRGGVGRDRGAHLHQNVVGVDRPSRGGDRSLVAVVVSALHRILENLDLG